MTDRDVCCKICEVFSTPMGLLEEDIKNDRLFPFVYLQRDGAGTRTLCVPSVKESFQWNGRQVCTLAKAGSFTYLLAEADLPGWTSLNDNQTSVSGEELPDLSSHFGVPLMLVHRLLFGAFTSNLYRNQDNDVIIIDPSPTPSLDGHSQTTLSLSQSTSSVHQSIAYTPPSLPFAQSKSSTSSFSQSVSPFDFSSTYLTQSASSLMRPAMPAILNMSSHDLDRLLGTFGSTVPAKQVTAVYSFSGEDYGCSARSLLNRPTLTSISTMSILTMVNERFDKMPRVKLYVDPLDMWADMVAECKKLSMNLHSPVCIMLQDQPAIDTGGVRQQVYSTVFSNFADNHAVRLFKGRSNTYIQFAQQKQGLQASSRSLEPR